MNTSDGINLKSSLLGFCGFHKDILLYGDHGVAIRNDEDFIRNPNRVMIISGGGSGHEPGQVGFVGQGMLSAAVCGNIFTSPSVTRFVKKCNLQSVFVQKNIIMRGLTRLINGISENKLKENFVEC